jgi:hypothetical protein
MRLAPLGHKRSHYITNCIPNYNNRNIACCYQLCFQGVFRVITYPKGLASTSFSRAAH